MDEDPNRRHARLRCCKLDGRSLLGIIENAPLGVVGDMVAFPVANHPLTPVKDVHPVATLVQLSTNGIHAEGVLGHCNTCEPKDDTRYRDCACCDDEAADPVLADPKALDLATLLTPEEIKKLLTLTIPESPKAELMATVIKELLAEGQKGSEKAQAMLKEFLAGVELPKEK